MKMFMNLLEPLCSLERISMFVLLVIRKYDILLSVLSENLIQRGGGQEKLQLKDQGSLKT